MAAAHAGIASSHCSVRGDNCSCWHGQPRKTAIASPNIPIFPAIFQNTWHTPFFPLYFCSCPFSLPYNPAAIQFTALLKNTWGFLLFSSSLAYLNMQKYWKNSYCYMCRWYHFNMSRRIVSLLCKSGLQHLTRFFQKAQQLHKKHTFILVAPLTFPSVTVLE